MPHLPEDTDPNTWHRYFAIECNNRTWELVERPRSPAEDLEMLNAAHASAFHWGQVGNELNHMRAKMLLAEVHAQLGYGQSAMAYAEEIRGYFLNRDTPDWELAFTHAIYAHAAFAAGNSEAHRAAYQEAVKAMNAIADEEDRKIVRKTFDQVPPP